MASSGNFCTWNPIAQGNKSNIAFSSGNCAVTSGSGQFKSLSNFLIPTNSGKWYVEVCMTSNSGNTSYVGIVSEKSPDLNATGDGFNFGRSSGDKTVYFDITIGKIKTENSDSQTGLSTFSSNDDIIGMVLDMDNDTVQFYGNGSAVGSAQAFPDTGDNYYIWCGGNNDKVCHINAGQDSTFGGALSAGGNTDGNYGDFKYSVPTDAKAITTANLPISADIDPAGDDGETENPTKQFGVVTYTGNGGSNAITGLGFQPDLVWAKSRSSAQNHILIDSSRGQGLLFSSLTNAEQTSNGPFMTSYDSDGFTLSSSGSNPNDSGQNYVAWCWRAGGGVTSSNTDGSITSTVQSSTSAGFSICTYIGTGSAGNFGHGLGAVPKWVMIKNRSSVKNWACYHVDSNNGGKKSMILNSNNSGDNSQYWNNTQPTSSVFPIRTETEVNASGDNHIAYCWTEVEGFSKFGSFEGNSNADGPMIVTNFRPRLVFCKSIDASENWQVRDTARSTSNADSQVRIYWNSSSAEGSASTASPIDFLSNGFKVKGSNSEINSNTIIYGAWADSPFKYQANTF